jgi:hypothetical protein
MLENRRRLILITCMFLAIPFLFGCFLDMRRVVDIAADNRGHAPIRRLRVTIDPSHQEELFNQLQKFADKHNFKVVISDYSTSSATYQVELSRKDFIIRAIHNSHDVEIVSIGFYDQIRATPVPEETLDAINDLVIDLVSYLEEIPDVTITEEK